MLIRIFAAFLIVFALTASSWRETAVKSPSQPYLVLIVMDGFRADYLTLARMHHLRALMARGMTYDLAWSGHLESTTPTGHATIATGVYPRKHGVVGFGWRDPASGGFIYMPTNLLQIRAGNLARQIQQGGVPTISELVHERDKHAVVVAASAEKYYAAATMGVGADYLVYGHETKHGFRGVAVPPNLPPPSTHYSQVSVPDATFDLQDPFAAKLAVQMVRTLRPRVLLLNLPAPDIAGHYYGGMEAPGDMAPIIRGTDGAVGLVINAYRKLGLLKNTIFLVTADHGMAGNRYVVPIHPMYNLLRQIPGATELDEEYRSSIGEIWLKDPSLAATVATTFASRHFKGVEGALYRVSPSRGTAYIPDPVLSAGVPKNVLRAYVRLAATEAGPTGPDVILPYREDASGLFVKKQKYWGTHGGFSWGVQHIPLIIAGPGVRHGVSHFPAKLVDIAPTVERLLGLPVPAGVDGVVLQDAIDRLSNAQGAVQPSRLADVTALRQHSAAQSTVRGR